jgi:hypothetical protein
MYADTWIIHNDNVATDQAFDYNKTIHYNSGDAVCIAASAVDIHLDAKTVVPLDNKTDTPESNGYGNTSLQTLKRAASKVYGIGLEPSRVKKAVRKRSKGPKPCKRSSAAPVIRVGCPFQKRNPKAPGLRLSCRGVGFSESGKLK